MNNKIVYSFENIYKQKPIITTSLNNGLFVKKQYMSDLSIFNSPILKTVLINKDYIHNILKLDINKVMNAICYVYMISKNDTLIRFPDKKIAQTILNSNRLDCYSLFNRLKIILPEYITYFNKSNNSYYSIKVNKEKFECDELIVEMSNYLYNKQLKSINLKSKRMKRKIHNIWKKYDLMPINKIEKRHALYYNNDGIFHPKVARDSFKTITWGLTWYWSQICEKYIKPEDLLEWYKNHNRRTDIFYLELPILLLSDTLKMNDIDIRKKSKGNNKWLW